MSLPVSLVGSNGYVVKVTKFGELVTAPLESNIVRHHTMSAIDTAYNFAPPIVNRKMLLQNILIYANKSVGAGDASIIIYTADSTTSTTVIDTVLELELPKYASRDLIGINLELGEGLFLNAKTNDNTIYLTMMGYYLQNGT